MEFYIYSRHQLRLEKGDHLCESREVISHKNGIRFATQFLSLDFKAHRKTKKAIEAWASPKSTMVDETFIYL